MQMTDVDIDWGTALNPNIDEIIKELLDTSKSRDKSDPILSAEEIEYLTDAASKIMLEQPVLLEIESPVKIVGNIHGHYTDLLRIFEVEDYPPYSSYLFLGNYVDRGARSLEWICLLLAFKIKYPESFYLLRGNHEWMNINRIYGFYDECKRRHNIKLWK